jgi:hypothetical protein
MSSLSLVNKALKHADQLACGGKTPWEPKFPARVTDMGPTLCVLWEQQAVKLGKTNLTSFLPCLPSALPGRLAQMPERGQMETHRQWGQNEPREILGVQVTTGD